MEIQSRITKDIMPFQENQENTKRYDEENTRRSPGIEISWLFMNTIGMLSKPANTIGDNLISIMD